MWFITIFIGVTLVFIIPRIGKGDPITSIITRIMNQQGFVENADQIIESYKERIADGAIKSFYEGELNHITEIFGTIAHRFSTYETKFDLDNSEPFSIGINSIQFMKIKNNWKISSIVWNNQNDELRIPDKYLP